MDRRHALTLIFSIVATVFSPLPAVSQYAQRWRSELADSSAYLKSGDYARALTIVDRVAADMVEHLGPGDAETHTFAIVLVHKALANAGLGKIDDALWYWDVALSLYPKVSESDTSMFGAPGQFLKEHPLPSLGETRASDAHGVTPPKVVRRRAPQFPRGAHYFRVDGMLIVEFVIDEYGHPKSPRVLKALPAPTLSYAALEALKSWEFEPARIDGRPVPVVFHFTVNYKY
jgi:TonB family protein